MKISPMPSHANTVGAISASEAQGNPATVQTARTIRMSTNATPGRQETQEAAPEAKPALTNPDPNNPVPAADEATKPLDPQAAAFAKQRRSLQLKERELADREKALEGKSAIPADVFTKARLKSETLRVLEEAGVTYDDLTQAILQNQSSGVDAKALKEEILKDLETGVEKKFTDRDAKAKQDVLAEMRRDANSLSAQGEEFELVRETKSIPHVMTLIERTYDESGEVLDVKEALRLIEDDLIEQASKIAGIKKVQSKIAPTAPLQPQRQGMRTLTNRDTAAPVMDRKARALAAFRGTLNK